MKRAAAKSSSWIGFSVLALGGVHCGGADATDDERPCRDIIQEASAAIDTAQRRADRSCAQDSDCFIFDFSISCIQQCSSGYGAGAIAARTTFEAANAALEQQYCTQLARPDCAAYLDANNPSCSPGIGPSETLCLNGKCELCGDNQCLLEDEMQLCNLIAGELRDCYSLRPPP